MHERQLELLVHAIGYKASQGHTILRRRLSTPLQTSICWCQVQSRQQGSPTPLHLVYIQDDAAAWERQVYTFAQHRQLPVLAPHIPIGIMAPTLRRQAYEMVRSSLQQLLL
jgi:hypothetical protein